MTGSDTTSDLSKTFALNLRTARLAAGLTQHALAVRLGRGDSMTISRWERGENRPTDENLVALGSVLGRSVAWFYTDHEAIAVQPGERAA